jgi:hypothetical protein
MREGASKRILEQNVMPGMSFTSSPNFVVRPGWLPSSRVCRVRDADGWWEERYK